MEPPRTNMLPCSQSEHNIQGTTGITCYHRQETSFPQGQGRSVIRGTGARHSVIVGAL